VRSATARTFATEIQVLDVSSGAVLTLARMSDLLPSTNTQDLQFGGLSWSPDGSLIAVAAEMQNQNRQAVILLSADTGTVRSRQTGTLMLFPFLMRRSWSPDGRYLLYWVLPVSQGQDEMGELRVWDTRTDQVVTLPAVGLWDWSPDGKWLAIAPQSEGGVLLAAPDLSSVGWLHEELTCVTVAWQPAIH